MIRLVIFDADGTLTAQRGGAAGAFVPELLPGVALKCASLRSSGCILAIASNQGGARWGRQDRRSLGSVHAQLRWTTEAIGASAYRFAVSKESDRYKPGPRMILELMEQFGVSAAETLFVGDQATDEQAAKAAGVEFAWAGEFFS